MLSTLVSHDVGRRDPSSTANYVPNREAWLKSKWLAERVVSDPSIAAEVSQYADPAFELFKTLVVQQVKKDQLVHRHPRRQRPRRTKRLLEVLLSEFREQARRENEDKLDNTADVRQAKPGEAQGQLDRALDAKIEASPEENQHDRPGRPEHPGRAICESRIDHGAEATAAGRHPSTDDDRRDVSQIRCGPRGERAGGADRGIEEDETQMSLEPHRHAGETVRNFNNDPAAIEVARILDDVIDEIEELRSVKTELASPPRPR